MTNIFKTYRTMIFTILAGLVCSSAFIFMPLYSSVLFVCAMAFACTVYLYFKNFEGFIILVLILCYDFADILPGVDKIHTYDLLFPILALALADIIYNKRSLHIPANSQGNAQRFFSQISLVLLVIVCIGVYMAYLNEGQPLLTGLRGGRRFLFVLFYFVIKARIRPLLVCSVTL